MTRTVALKEDNGDVWGDEVAMVMMTMTTTMMLVVVLLMMVVLVTVMRMVMGMGMIALVLLPSLFALLMIRTTMMRSRWWS